MNKPASILIIEDTTTIAMVYSQWLTKAGHKVRVCGTAQEGLDQLASGEYAMLLLDLSLPDMDGLELLRRLRAEGNGISVVVVTASGSIATAVSAMREGASDIIGKPASEERLVTTVRNLAERDTLRVAVRQMRQSIGDGTRHGFVGSSLPMLSVYRTIDAVASSNASVFITGESGTGKEVCAQAIHKASNRGGAPFIALNCAAIPKDLIESEVFGHVKGAFTGATTDREGAAAAAHGGTLFLDEICEMDIGLQAKLLRFLQTGNVQKVGSDKVQKVDVRIVCATNRDPWKAVEEGNFREDLYFRLHVVPLHLPPLRERESDIVEIAEALLRSYAKEEGKEFSGFDEEAIDALLSYSWPGNVREMQNVVRNAVVLNAGGEIARNMLSFAAIRGAERSTNRMEPIQRAQMREGAFQVDLERPFDDIEREIIEAVISRHGGSIPRAAEVLRLSPSTIYRKREGWAKALAQSA
jgi:two-component system repressor protein LuxO